MKLESERSKLCIILIGMAAAGKTTLATRLAQELGWACMDSDSLIESLYGARLQDITDAMDKETFLDVECETILSIRASRCVIATGGSVIYRPKAMEHLASLGPIIHVRASLQSVEDRIARNPDRGLVIAPGQSLANLFAERQPLYERAANIICDTDNKSPGLCVGQIMEALTKWDDKKALSVSVN